MLTSNLVAATQGKLILGWCVKELELHNVPCCLVEGFFFHPSLRAAVLSAFLAAARGHERNNYTSFCSWYCGRVCFPPSSGKILLLQAEVASLQNCRGKVIVLNKYAETKLGLLKWTCFAKHASHISAFLVSSRSSTSLPRTCRLQEHCAFSLWACKQKPSAFEGPHTRSGY